MLSASQTIRPPHGERLLIAEFDKKARNEPNSPWVSIPVDDDDLSKGYQDVTYGQLASAVNAAVTWLRLNLPASPGSLTSFAYVGGRDLRYPIFALAAAKLGLVMICPASTVTAEAQKRIMDQKDCTIFLYDSTVVEKATELVRYNERINTVQAPALSTMSLDRSDEPCSYERSREEAQDDPWIAFHTSGTTGHPKVITYSQAQFGACDIALGLEGIKETNFHHYEHTRWLLPLPLLHFSGMFMVLPMTVFAGCVPVLCPASKIPSISIIKDILRYTTVSGASMAPAMIDALCADPEALPLIKKMKNLNYVGAPLSTSTGKLLSSDVGLAPAIGSTDAGGYFIEIVNHHEDWDYISFQPHAGVVMEPRLDNMYELVFVKNPECLYQPLFWSRPGITRFPTKDLWIEHPTKKNQWKIVGRADDYIAVASGEGLYVASLEPILQEHPAVQTALIGGQAKPKPVILLELTPSMETEIRQSTEKARELIESLTPYIDRANERCHESVKLDSSLIIFVKKEKPLARTVKDTVSRAAALKLYEEEIEAVYQ